MVAVAVMEAAGVPIDTVRLAQLQTHRNAVCEELILATDVHQVYVGSTFTTNRFEALLASKDISWPRLKSGKLDLKDETFKQMARQYPEVIAPYWELRAALVQLRELRLTVGPDGRNRALLSPFRSITGRNQPSSNKFIFGLPSSMRSLIKPPPGFGLAHIDYSQQEFGIAAALSDDPAMLAAYLSGDPYMEFAI